MPGHGVGAGLIAVYDRAREEGGQGRVARAPGTTGCVRVARFRSCVALSLVDSSAEKAPGCVGILITPKKPLRAKSASLPFPESCDQFLFSLCSLREIEEARRKRPQERVEGSGADLQ